METGTGLILLTAAYLLACLVAHSRKKSHGHSHEQGCNCDQCASRSYCQTFVSRQEPQS